MRLFRNPALPDLSAKGHVAGCRIADHSLRCAEACRCEVCVRWDEFKEAIEIA
jgi:hypothetical protein